MKNMFRGSEFNGDLSEWDVSNVKSIYNMFVSCKFSGDLSNWKLKNLQTHDINASIFSSSPLARRKKLWPTK
jgi:hypothetical protein